MSNAIPMALRPATRIAYQWNSVTLAFARRYCAQQSHLKNTSQPSCLLILRSQNPSCASRSFSTASRLSADVHNPLADVVPPQQPYAQQRKRTVKIGPLPNGRVDDATIRRIFGNRVTGIEGNQVLRILHHRRTSGSLADYGVDNLGQQYTHVSRGLATKALDWLREAYPIDEARAAEAWTEKEANRIAYELWLADPENESKYKDPARAFREQQKKQKEEQEALQERQDGRQRIGMLHVGPSQFERNIAQKRQERLDAITQKAQEKEAKEKEMEAKLATGEYVRTPSGTQLMKPDQTTYVDIFGREQVSRRKEMTALYQQKSQTEFKTQEEMLSKTTLFQRLYPMSAFVFLICLISYGVGHYYEPPADEYRLWPDVSIKVATITAIVGANIFVCIGWRIMPLWPLLTRYFMHVPGYPRAVQSVFNVFSHVQYEHLLGNMMILGLVGPVCLDLVGRGVFMGTYVSAGAFGTLASLYWANLGRGDIAAHSIGASAAIWGIAALYCLLSDHNSLKIPFIKDMEVSFYPKLLIVGFVVAEILTARRRAGKSAADHASHFGGLAVGVAVAGYMRLNQWLSGNEAAEIGGEGVQGEKEVKVVDPVAIVKGQAGEVKEAVKKVTKPE